MTLTNAHWRRRNQIAGQIITFLRKRQPSPAVVSSIREALDLNKVTLYRALERCQDIGAIHVDWGSRLVTLLDANVHLPQPPDETPAPQMPTGERQVYDAILRRVAILVHHRGKPDAAIALLQRAASRCRGPVAVNFLALADLYAAGHRRYPTITRAEAWRLQAQAGVSE